MGFTPPRPPYRKGFCQVSNGSWCKTFWNRRQYDSRIRDYGKLTSAEEAEYRKLKRERDLLLRLDLRIVHDDFYTFHSRKSYDLIAMNPPFADGDAHLLKAIELQRRGGMIRCILLSGRTHERDTYAYGPRNIKTPGPLAVAAPPERS